MHKKKDEAIWHSLPFAESRRKVKAYHTEDEALYRQIGVNVMSVDASLRGNLAKGMRQRNGVYTQSFNLTHKRVGHVFQGRYKAIIVEKSGYLLELARHVVLNPMRTHMVKDIVRWLWRSYVAMIGTRPAQDWLQTDWMLG